MEGPAAMTSHHRSAFNFAILMSVSRESASVHQAGAIRYVNTMMVTMEG